MKQLQSLGEHYPVREIAPDGQNIRFSPDGTSAVFEVTQENRLVAKSTIAALTCLASKKHKK